MSYPRVEPLFVNQSSHEINESDLTAWLSLVFRELADCSVWPQKYETQFPNREFPEEVVVVFVNEDKAQALNSQFRGKEGATDVLSFSSEDPMSLGELILCPEVIGRQASENDHSWLDECCYLILHGVLHLLGFEHEQGGEAAKEMYSLQDAVFEQIDKIR
jgi:probable rRNA maturation factor